MLREITSNDAKLIRAQVPLANAAVDASRCIEALKAEHVQHGVRRFQEVHPDQHLLAYEKASIPTMKNESDAS